MNRPLIYRVSLFAFVASVLLVVLGLFSVGLMSNQLVLASHGSAVISLDLRSENTVGVVGPDRDKITVVAVRNVTTISESLTIILSATPGNSVHFYPLEEGQDFLPGGQIIFGSGVESVDFFVEWREAGKIAISAVDEDELLVPAVVEVTIAEAEVIDDKTPPADEPNREPEVIGADTGADTAIVPPGDAAASTDETPVPVASGIPENNQSGISLERASSETVIVGEDRVRVELVHRGDDGELKKLADAIVYELLVDPIGTVRFYSSASGPDDIDRLRIEADSSSVEFFIEPVVAGMSTVTARSPGEDGLESGGEEFDISPGAAKTIRIDSTFTGRNIVAGTRTPYDYRVVVVALDSLGNETSVPTGTILNYIDAKSASPVFVTVEGAKQSVPTFRVEKEDKPVSVDLNLPNAADDLNLRVTASGFRWVNGPPSAEILLAARPISVNISSNSGELYFGPDRELADLRVELLSRNRNNIADIDRTSVALYLFDGKEKRGIWGRTSPNDPEKKVIEIPAGRSEVLFSIRASILQNTSTVKLCVAFDGFAIDESCRGIDIPVVQELSIFESAGGAVIGWDYQRNATYEISLVSTEQTEFVATAGEPDQVRTSSMLESFNGVAKTIVSTSCQPESDPNCEIRVWIDKLANVGANLQFKAEVRIKDLTDDSMQLVAVGTIESLGPLVAPGDLTTEVIEPDEGDTVWGVQITPSVEDGGLDQSFQIRYRTAESEAWVSAVVPFNVWKRRIFFDRVDRPTFLVWNEFELAPDQELVEVVVTPFNSEGPGNPAKATFQPPSNIDWFISGGWILVFSWLGGSLVFLVLAWQLWRVAQSRRSKSWLDVVAPESEKTERDAIGNFIRVEPEADRTSKLRFALVLISRAKLIFEQQDVARVDLRESEQQLVFSLAKSYSDSALTRGESDISSAEKERVDLLNRISRSNREINSASEELATIQAASDQWTSKRDSVQSDVESLVDRQSELQAIVDELNKTHEARMENLESDFEKEVSLRENQLGVLRQQASASKQERARIESQGFDDLVESAVSSVTSDRVLEDMSAGGQVRQNVDLNDLVRRLGELQEDGIAFTTSGKPGDFTMTHPAVNDLAGMRKLVEGSIRAFGAWMIKSTPIELDAEDSKSFDPTKVERTVELKDLDEEFGVVGFGLASGLERVFELATDRLSDQTGSDDRTRKHVQAEFLEGAAQAVETLLSSNLNVVYPEFYEALGLEEGEIEGLRVGSGDRGPADALAIYVVNDWFSQMSDDVVRSQARTTLAEVQRLQNDQQLTAYGFKNVVMANMQTRWSFSEDEAWSPSTISGFSVICDYIVRYIHADIRSSWS